MNNAQIASALAEVAELLELKKESTFRIRAYENAAKAVVDLTENVAVMAAQEELTGIKGIGKGIAERIHEYVSTGRIAYLEELRTEFPDGVREMLAVPGVGPTLARRVYLELGVQSLDELRLAAEDGRLASLSGLGEKSAHNVIRGLQRTSKKDSRLSIGTVVPVVDDLLAQLSARVAIENLTAAGSFRRWAPTIGDVDLIGTSDDPERVMDAFCTLPQVRDITGRGHTKSSIVTNDGLQVDLRIVPSESYGSLLQHFTGSQQHNIELREYALQRGMSLNEYGIARVGEDGRRHFTDEGAFYAALGLPWIPPELRQAGGEIAAAERHELPNLVQTGDVRGDLHVHTDWSDGSESIEVMVQTARARGYDYVAITDHSGGIGVAHGLQEDRLRAQIDIVREIDRSSPDIRVLCGTELDIRRDGTLDFANELLEELDWVIASVHSGFNQSREDMTARIVRAIQNPHVHAIAHPTGRLINKREPYDVDLEQVFRAAAAHNTALEINSWPERLDLTDTHVRRAIQMGVRIVINTDAHATANFENLRYGVAMARRGWARAQDVLNTRTYEDLRIWLTSSSRAP